MSKRKWNDEKLQKRSQTCMFAAVLFAFLLAGFYFANVSALLLMVPMIGAIVFYTLSWFTERKDRKIQKAKVDKKVV